MGCLTFLVSDEKREWLDLGKLFLDELLLLALKKSADPAKTIADYLRDGEYDDVRESEIDGVAAIAAVWMRAHSDWRFLTEYDDAYDDVYLAEDKEDADEYVQEFPGDHSPIYRKTGSIWPKETS